jgi:peptidoglycan/xylan/chitin deacetylase (PgdA/CDA1 family)
VLRKLKPGGIIVLHDAGKTIDSEVDRTPTIEALNVLLDEILEKGYSFHTISEMINT